jgi:hypothetical protein
LKDGFDTDADLLQMTPAFMDQAVTAARALALQAVGDPKSVPLETTYGSPANMILSLAAAPAPGSGNQQRYKDGMPFGTRGGMSVEHNFPADGEYVLTIGDMALARTVPNMEFDNTVIALLDGKEFWRTHIAHGGRHLPASELRRGRRPHPAVPARRRSSHGQSAGGWAAPGAGSARLPHQGPGEDHRHERYATPQEDLHLQAGNSGGGEALR